MDQCKDATSSRLDIESISQLSDIDLMVQLRQHVGSTPPVTRSTRPILERRLLKYLGLVNDPVQVQLFKEESNNNVNNNVISENTKPPTVPSAEKTPTSFYGVQLADGQVDQEVTIFTDQKEALKFVKKHKGSRFKLFSSEGEARSFSAADLSYQSPRPAPSTDNKEIRPAEGSAFRSVKPQELVALRKLIETGNVSELKSRVWQNPRYLISSGDTPTVLQEGSRYNGLHSAALKNQRGSCEVIISTIEDPAFMSRMYPDDTDETRTNRINFLLDLYLNTPDKGFNETPLHFACKFGHKDVVEVLASHPRIEKERRNRDGQTPRDVICSRIPHTIELKKQIESCFEDRVYVPLLRSEDTTYPAKVAQPLPTLALPHPQHRDLPENTLTSTPSRGHGSPMITHDRGQNSPLRVYGSPIRGHGSPIRGHESPVRGHDIGHISASDPEYAVKAYAGPMSPVEAKRFRRTWLTPPSLDPHDRSAYKELRLGDSSKGLERIGRHLAEDMRVPWAEYWDFLGCFTNLASKEGVDRLERHLQTQSILLMTRDRWCRDLDSIATRMDRLCLDDSLLSDQSQSELSKTNQSEADESKTDQSGLNTTPNYVQFIENFSSQCQGSLRGTRTDLNPNPASSINILQPSKLLNHTLNIVPGKCLSHEGNGRMNSDNCPGNLDNCPGDQEMSSDSSSDDSCDGSGGSFRTADDDIDLDYQDASTDQHDQTVFIWGSDPCKTDLDVLRAVDEALISYDLHPHVHRWRNHVLRHSEKTRARWPLHKDRPHTSNHPPSTPVPVGTPLHLPPADLSSGDSWSSTSLSTTTTSSEDEISMRQVRANLMQSFAHDLESYDHS